MSHELYVYHAKLERIVDGDTYDLQFYLGFHIMCSKRVRLKNVDTPEIYGVKHSSDEYERGKAASDFVERWFAEHGPLVMVKTHGDETGAYGRWLAEVFSEDGKHSLEEALLEAGHAELYEGA